MHDFYGQPGLAMTMGVAALSRWHWKHASSSLLPQIPASDGGPLLNRVLNEMTINIDGADVHFLGTHVEWFGDPGVQIQAIAERVRNISGPVVLMGDFNLWPNGANTASACETDSCHWEHGLCNPHSFFEPGCFPAPDSLRVLVEAAWLKSAVNPDLDGTTVGRTGLTCLGRTGKTEVVDGCQLDYIFYRGLELVESAIHDVNVCSDHLIVTASFRV